LARAFLILATYATIAVLLVQLAQFGIVIHAYGSVPPRTEFEPRPDLDSASGFKLSKRDNLAQLSLDRGQSGTFPVTVTSYTNRSLNIVLVTLDITGLNSSPKLPPGVRLQSSPSNFTLAPQESKSLIFTLTADEDAPAESYVSHVVARSDTGESVGWTGFWLVIGPEPNSFNIVSPILIGIGIGISIVSYVIIRRRKVS